MMAGRTLFFYIYIKKRERLRFFLMFFLKFNFFIFPDYFNILITKKN